MTAITELKNELEKGARAFKTFENGVKALSLLEGLEQNEIELKKRIDALVAQEKDWLAKKSAALSSAEDAAKRAADNVASAADEAKKMIEEGRKQASGVLGDAKDKAAKLIAQAELLVEKHTADAQSLAEENSSVSALVKAGKEELSSIQEAMAKHKEAIKQFVG